jgi:hypothetical protein
VNARRYFAEGARCSDCGLGGTKEQIKRCFGCGMPFCERCIQKHVQWY